MPYNLIKRLNALMEKDFPSQYITNNPVLGRAPTQLSDALLEEIDAIAQLARQMFPKIEPSFYEQGILAAAGFPARAGSIKSGIWQNGFIVTPRGWISYR